MEEIDESAQIPDLWVNHTYGTGSPGCAEGAYSGGSGAEIEHIVGSGYIAGDNRQEGTEEREGDIAISNLASIRDEADRDETDDDGRGNNDDSTNEEIEDWGFQLFWDALIRLGGLDEMELVA